MFHCGVEFVASIVCLTTVVIIGLITKIVIISYIPEQGVTYMESMKMWTKTQMKD